MQLLPRVCHLRADKALRRLQRPKGAGRVYSRCLEEMHEGTALQKLRQQAEGVLDLLHVSGAAVTAQALRKRATERKRMRLVAEVWSEIDQRQALAHNRDEPSRKVPRLSERTTASITYTYSCPRVPGRSDQHVPKRTCRSAPRLRPSVSCPRRRCGKELPACVP